MFIFYFFLLLDYIDQREHKCSSSTFVGFEFALETELTSYVLLHYFQKYCHAQPVLSDLSVTAILWLLKK